LILVDEDVKHQHVGGKSSHW